jgi:hypothetical protein
LNPVYQINLGQTMAVNKDVGGGDKPVTRASNQLSFLFLLFGAIGTIAVFLFPGTLGMIIAVGAILTYFLIGFFVDKRVKNSEKFADSLYYLGFLLTLLALLKFTLGEEKTTAELIKSMGTGMATTICGLSLRVIMLQFRETISDQDEEAKDIISKELRVLEERIDFSKKLFIEVESTTLKSINTFSRLIEDGTKDLGSSLINMTKEMNVCTKEISSNTVAARTLLEKLFEPSIKSVTKTNESIENGLNELCTTLASLTERVNAVNVPKKMIENRMDRMIEIFQEKATEGLEPLVEAQKEIVESIKTMQPQLNLLNNLLAGHNNFVKETVSITSNILNTAKAISTAGEAFILAGTEAGNYGQVIRELTDNMKHSINNMGDIANAQKILVAKIMELTTDMEGTEVTIRNMQISIIGTIKEELTNINGQLKSVNKEVGEVTSATERNLTVLNELGVTIDTNLRENILKLNSFGEEIAKDLKSTKTIISDAEQVASELKEATMEVSTFLRDELKR